MKMYHEAIVTKKESFTLPKGMRLLCRHTRIKGHENYSIYDDGRVYSHVSNKFLKTCPLHGYLTVNLNRKSMLHHRLVAQAFIKNPELKPEVNHIDGVKTNNHWTNLEWSTRSENAKHAFDIGLSRPGEHHFRAKVTDAQMTDIKMRLKAGQRQADIEEHFGLRGGYLKYVVSRNGWSHISIDGLHNPYMEPEPCKKNLIAYTKWWLKTERISQQNLARIIGVNGKTLNSHLTGRKVSPSIHKKLSDFFNK
ncbi:HNH endonuclease [Exiguobacterium aurantiacum]|uniref:HNH endonuclease n=1 Tax=Exiguobacterium aurantiacum TaxID=33987 RepID=UPI00384BA18D